MILSKEQKNAIEFDEGACLLVAGPGSGKTRVITERLFHLTVERNVPDSNILVVTFTKAAAKEMEARFQTKRKSSSVTFGTFHSVFFQILSMESSYKRENIIDEKKKERLLKDIKNKLSEEMLKLSKEKKDQVIRSAYEEEKRKRRLLDFDDIIIKTKVLLSENGTIRRKWQKKFSYILVDEFQDISALQYDCIRILSGPENNLFVVGDDDQSIYAFRGASPDCMKWFVRDHKDAKILYLSTNYRSKSRIVEASSALISNNTHFFKKRFYAFQKEQGKFSVTAFQTADMEAEEIAKTIFKMREKMPDKSIAVLFRTLFGTDLILSKLSEKGVPYVVQDEIENPFQSPVARLVFSYLNYVIGDRTKENFIYLMNIPERRILREDLPFQTVDLLALKARYQKMRQMEQLRNVQKLEKDFEFLSSLQSPYLMIRYLRKGMLLDKEFERSGSLFRMDQKKRMETLDFIEESAKSFSLVPSWYRFIASFTENLHQKERHISKNEKVTVSTIHKSKGLEYDTVFIPFLSETILPHEKSMGSKDLVEEERRILYVGMTRAKEELFLSCSEERFGKSMERSRFLEEIEAHHKS